MTLYILGRILRGFLTVLGVVTISFFILRLNGSPAVAMIPTATAEQIAQLNKALGFTGSTGHQYLIFIKQVLQGHLGTSLTQPGVPALDVVWQRLPATLELTLISFTVGLLAGFAIAMTVQLTGNQRLRNMMIWLGVTRQAIPTFLFGVLLVLLFSVELHWLPSIGRGGWQHLVLPVLTLATFEITLYARLIDSSLLEQQDLDYVRTAYAKGQRRVAILNKHMLPNALLPLLTVAALNFGALLGGAVVVENVFDWPGVGQLLVYSVNARDYPVIQATLIVTSVAFVTINIIVDLLYAALDPRVRLR